MRYYVEKIVLRSDPQARLQQSVPGNWFKNLQGEWRRTQKFKRHFRGNVDKTW